MERRIIVTGDGSRTIHLVDWNEHYHSKHGALQEAKHVFISYLEKYLVNKEEATIFEMGLGTGLNAGLSALVAEKLNKKVSYFCLEAFPLDANEFVNLGYDELLDQNKIFQAIHHSKWGEWVTIHPNFEIYKAQTSLENFVVEHPFADLVYFDAFGPRVQPELWTVDIFKKIFGLTREGGWFLTYCAKGQVRRDLSEVGFSMEKVPGPPGKREMLIGRKTAQ